MIEEEISFQNYSLRIKENPWRVKFWKTIHKLNMEEWKKISLDSNIYMSYEYLSSIEDTMSDEMKFTYAITYDESNAPVLIQYFQLVQFSDKRRTNANALLNHLKGNFKLSEGYNTDILVCGNVFSDGENGMMWSSNTDANLLISAASSVAKLVCKRNEHQNKVSLVLHKDYWPESSQYVSQLSDFGYQEFMIDVNMVLDIQPQWEDMETYLSTMKTKYRTRAKGVFKKAKEIEIHSLNSEEITKHSDRIQDLFSNVQEKSEYKMGTISSTSFVRLKERLKDKFILKGAFYNDNLVGFSTSFINQSQLEANYVGMDYEINQNMAIYQYLLYDLVEETITRELKQLHLGRTSELMKSALGAKPVNMKLYGKHQSKIPNIVVKAVLRKIAPTHFELRKPFKETFEKLWTH